MLHISLEPKRSVFQVAHNLNLLYLNCATGGSLQMLLKRLTLAAIVLSLLSVTAAVSRPMADPKTPRAVRPSRSVSTERTAVTKSLSENVSATTRPFGLMSVVDGRRSIYYQPERYFPDDHIYDGKLRGLVDGNGKQILAQAFGDIAYAGNGLYIATETDENHYYHFSARKRIFNKDGQEQPFKLPPKSRLFCVLSLGHGADGDLSQQLDRLPKETILCCAEQKKLGACDISGRLLVPMKYEFINLDLPAGAYFSVVTPGTGQIVHDLLNFKSKKLERTATNPPQCSRRVITQNFGNRGQLTNTEREIYSEIGPDRWLATVSREPEPFDKEYWCERRTDPISALEMFSRFLKDNKLVGMTEEQVFRELGEPDTISPSDYAGAINSMSYQFALAGWRSAFGVRLYITSARVSGWTLFNGEQESSMVRTNGTLETLKPQLHSFKFPGAQYPQVQGHE
jgi:hypothetical protein